MNESSNTSKLQNVDKQRDKSMGGGSASGTLEHDEFHHMHPKAIEYVKELKKEKFLLDHLEFPHALRLIEKEIEKTESIGRAPPKETKYIDILKDKPIKVAAKVLVPVKTYPLFNFIGKILGPKGNSLRRLQEETRCRILIQGRGSMRNPEKEEELRNSSDPKYGHLSDLLNVEVSALAPPSEAHARMSYALAELAKFLIPNKTDEISLRQMDEIEKITGQKVRLPIPTSSKTHYNPIPLLRKAQESTEQPRFLLNESHGQDKGFVWSQFECGYRNNRDSGFERDYRDGKYSKDLTFERNDNFERTSIQRRREYDPLAMIKKFRMSTDQKKFSLMESYGQSKDFGGELGDGRGLTDFNPGRGSAYDSRFVDRQLDQMQNNVDVNIQNISGPESAILSYPSSGAQKLPVFNAPRFRSVPYVPYTRRIKNPPK